MTELEKVIKGLECCEMSGQTEAYCRKQKCPYVDLYARMECVGKLHGDALELLKEIKPYGGFIELPYGTDALTGYAAIVERMMKAGILKVEKQEAPMLTRYNWAIKAVKWDE